jgi:hypothetical protein
MILRFFRAIVHDGKQNEFRDFFLGTALPNVARRLALSPYSWVYQSMNPQLNSQW